MALKSVPRALLVIPSTSKLNSCSLSSLCCASSTVLSENDKTKKFLHLHRRPFHHSFHGILFDALQNSPHRIPGLSSTDNPPQRDHLHLNIPDELRRLKSGSLKWLFQVWPGSNSKSYSHLTSIKSTLKQDLKSDANVDAVLSKNQRMLRTASEQQLYDVLDYLKSKNVAIRRLIRLPWLLTSEPSILEESVLQVKRILHLKSFQVAISFVNQNHLKLGEIATLWGKEWKGSRFQNRLDWLSYQLQVPEEDVSDMMARFPTLMTLPIQNITEILTVTLNANLVTSESIVQDPWLFLTNVRSVHARAKILQDNQIGPVKPWLFRAPQKRFEIFVEKHLEKRELLGAHKDVKGFLQERLQFPPGGGPGGRDTPEEMLIKVPALKTATVIKLNEMIEFLFSAGFSPRQIRETPRILAHSVETISERLQEITVYKKPINNLHLLCRTSKDYRAILRSIKRDAKARKAANKTPNLE